MKLFSKRSLAALIWLGMLAGCASNNGPDLAQQTAPQPAPIPWSALNEGELRLRIARLIPDSVRDKKLWAADLQKSFSSLKIPAAAESYCACIAIIEQESSFQVDPVIPGLPAIVQNELDQRAKTYGIPKLLLAAALQKTSPDGHTYRERIDALKTEKQLNALFEDMIAELPFGQRWLADYNPVHTAGPMQVSVRFAEQHVQEKGYPYPITKNVRDEVFTRRGGLYFGVAILLDYPAPYDEVIYRFADFNAGRYASRNAAFQQILGRQSGKSLVLDGDLLRYRDGKPIAAASEVESALQVLGGKLQMSPTEIRRDLQLEKSAEFADTLLYKRFYALAEKAAGKSLARQAMPEIDLKSPKITRKLSTEWFARRVENRYQNCLQRSKG